METELEVRISRKSQISFSKKYSNFISLEEFLEEMQYYFDHNRKYTSEDLFSVIFDKDMGMCVTVQFDRNYYKKNKYKKGRYTIIGFSDLEEMEEGLECI